MPTLTKQQRGLLNFITKFNDKHGYSPSYREIMASLGYASTSTVALHVDSLVERGYLRKRKYASRTLEPVNADELLLSKRIAAATRDATPEDVLIITRALIMLGFYDAAESLQKRYSGTLE